MIIKNNLVKKLKKLQCDALASMCVDSEDDYFYLDQIARMVSSIINGLKTISDIFYVNEMLNALYCKSAVRRNRKYCTFEKCSAKDYDAYDVLLTLYNDFISTKKKVLKK